MSLNSALSIAAGGLANINRQLSVVSQNVANAGTPGYAREVAQQRSVTAEGVGMGVQTLPVGRATDALLASSLLLQNAMVAGLSTRQSALAAIDTVHGTPGQGTDLGSLLGKVQDAFSSLAASPDNQTAQSKTVNAARTLTDGINALATAYGVQRQGAQDALASDVASLNTTLSGIGSLSDRIVALKASGQSTADLENQRDGALTSLSQLIDVKALTQSNGDMMLLTASGLNLPIHMAAAAFAIAPATLGPGAYYPGGGVPAITLGGADVTRQIASGRIGANIALRDATLPTAQAGLDEFSQTLATRFDAQGLRLFTDPAGAVPAGGGVPVQSGYVGLANIIGVNPAVQASSALVRDGTTPVAGSPSGASAFTPNPVGGPGGFATMITRVLDYALGTQVQKGVAQPPANSTLLGPAGSLATSYAMPANLSGMASALVADQSQDSAQTAGRVSSEQALQTALQGKLSTSIGVNVDTEMSTMIQLQSAYGANARVIAAAQAMWTQLLQLVP